MGTGWFKVFGALIVVVQVSALVTAEKSACAPGFESDLLIFKVFWKHLRPGARLGRVGFTDCTNHTGLLFSSSDPHFVVKTDGVLTVNRSVVLHEGHRDFLIHSWDSQGHKMTVPVSVVHHEYRHGNHRRHHHGHSDKHHHGNLHRHHHGHHHRHHHGHHHRHHHINHTQNVEHHHRDHRNHSHQHHTTEVDTEVPVLHFPKSVRGLRRSKREWVIPDLHISENHRGPYPLKVSQIRSNEDTKKKIQYSITGPGADQSPVGLFFMNKDTGVLYATQKLDREKQDKYVFEAHAKVEGSGSAEEPTEITVIVIDQNDNNPVFKQSTFTGEVSEASPIGFEVMKVEATDADEPNSDNSDIRYRILSQEPKSMFEINPINGVIRVAKAALDRETCAEYTLRVQAADLQGEGLTGEAKVILKVTDSNDNSPNFSQTFFEATVEENKKDLLVVKMSVTDADQENTGAWNAKFNIVSGDPEGLFTVKTGTNKQEGIITTAMGLDFEKSSKHTLLVTVENEVPFSAAVSTSTATVVVNVKDVNEAPVFDPKEKLVVRPENLAVGDSVVQYTASDPDTARKQTVKYKLLNDPAGWLNVDMTTGLITVRTSMDRESIFVSEDKYTALIGAYDDDAVPATGTGTLIIQLEDVNDNAPTIDQREIRVCNKDSAPQLLSVTDKDGPLFGPPYRVLVDARSRSNWTARMNESKTGIILNLATELPSGEYTVFLNVRDSHGQEQLSTIKAFICDCKGAEVTCDDRAVAGSNLPVILGILGFILLLLMLVLLLLLFMRRRSRKISQPLLPEDDRANLCTYDEQGGGEDDQDYDLSVIHHGLDNRPDVMRTVELPVAEAPPQYRPRPANPEEIGNFIDDNLKAADNDPTAPPYDSLLVFDFEGELSDAGKLSSLNSSNSGDQDYDCLSEWGPRFKKLADMYGGGEDDDML